MYRGDWMNDNMHGKGVYTWNDGRKYEGEYQNDKKHVHKFALSCQINRIFLCILKCCDQGFGVYSWPDGRKYEGEWINGRQHGKGKFIHLDGTVKKGIWENGKCIKGIEEGGAGVGAAQ